MTKQLTFLTLSTITAATFLLFPQIDLAVSGLFYYNPQEKFALEYAPIPMFIHNSVTYLTKFLLVLWFALLALNYLKKKDIFGLTKKQLAYLILALALGPGLVVNAIFKDNWGRARPNTITEFGGTKTFTPPFIMSDQCEKNCSFVSGDPSVGFYFFALALVIPARKKLFSSLAMGLGCVYGATRIIQGAHFFSDVIFSGVFTFAVCWGLWWVMFGRNRELRN